MQDMIADAYVQYASVENYAKQYATAKRKMRRLWNGRESNCAEVVHLLMLTRHPLQSRSTSLLRVSYLSFKDGRWLTGTFGKFLHQRQYLPWGRRWHACLSH